MAHVNGMRREDCTQEEFGFLVDLEEKFNWDFRAYGTAAIRGQGKSPGTEP
jgi:hypothetical protein